MASGVHDEGKQQVPRAGTSSRTCHSHSPLVLAPWAMLAAIAFVPRAALAEPLEKTTRTGPVEATVHLEPVNVRIGDPVILTLRVVAEKGVELLMPEFGQALERFSILDFAQREQIDDEQRTVSTQTYQLQPPRSGRQSIPPVMIEFVDRRDGKKSAPDDLDAYELLTERLAFEVQSVLPKNAEADLHPPLGELPPLVSKQWVIWPWVVLLLAALVAAPFARRAWSARRRVARRQSAYDIAMARLEKLQPPTSSQQLDPFFVELSAIVRWYLETRFELRAPELTTEEFFGLMGESPDLSDNAHGREYQSLLRDFLCRADLVKFARFVPSPQDIEGSVATARRFLEETSQDSPLVEQPVSRKAVRPVRSEMKETAGV